MHIKNFIQEYEDGKVQVSPEITYSTKEVINNSYRLYNGKFETDKDASGLEKVMLNISWIVYRTLFYGSDIDTKDAQMRSLNGKGVRILEMLRMATISHLNRTGFGDFIDDVRSDLAAFGSVIVKIVDGVPYTCDLRNIIRPAHESDVQKTGLVEKRYWSYDECMAMRDEWDNFDVVETVFDTLEKKGIPQVLIYDFWHEGYLEKEDGKKNRKMHKICERYIDCSQIDPKHFSEKQEWHPQVKLEEFKTPHKKRRATAWLRKKYGEYEELYPYKSWDFIKVKGRGLGFGVFEMLSGLMVIYNEKWHLYRKKDILDLKGIFVHKVKAGSRSLEQQFLNNLDNGAAVQIGIDEDLQRLIIDTKTGELISSTDKIFELARQIVGITAQGAGQDMPSTTTATVAIANKQTQQTTYDYLIERVALFMKEFFQDFYMEQIVSELTEEEVVSISGSARELMEMDKFLVDNAVNQAVVDYYNQSGIYPDEQEVETIRESVMQAVKQTGNERFAQIKKDLLKDLDYYAEFYINNEGFDKAVKIQNLMQILQTSTTLSREQIEKVIIDSMGENSRQFEKTDEEIKKEQEMLMAQQAAENAPVNPISNQPQDQQFQFANSPIRR